MPQEVERIDVAGNIYIARTMAVQVFQGAAQPVGEEVNLQRIQVEDEFDGVVVVMQTDVAINMGGMLGIAGQVGMYEQLTATLPILYFSSINDSC